MQSATARDLTPPPATRSVAEIRLIWNEARRRQSTLGRLRAVTPAPSRFLTVHIPQASTPRPHEQVSSWRQLIGDRPR